MDRRFGEDPGDVDIKTKGHSPKPDGAYFRDSFAVLPSAHAEKLIGSVKAGSLKAEQEAAREARATEPDRGPSRPAITPRLDAINLAQAARSKDNESLLKEAPARVLELASRQDVLKEAEEGQEKSFPGDRAYIPRPDDKFGYRRTDRTDAELSDIKARMQKEAERNSIIAKGFDAGAADISDNISKAAKEAQSELEQIGKQQEQLSQILQSLKSGVSSANLDERLLKNLPADLARDLNLARFNRHAYDQNLAAVNNPEYNPFGMNTEKLQGNARQAVSYYKAQELRAVEKASSYLQFNEDRIKNQQRVINDAGRPQDDARKLLQLHFQSKSVAASILASNPDLLANKHAKGAMEGRRIAINSGHDPFHGSETPGFSGYDWSKTTENPKGMREYDFNRNTSAILGAMVEFTGGVPIYINQDELYKQGNVAAQRMSGLAEAMAASKADIYISHHMDDDPRFKAPGTLTLVGKDAHKLGALVNDGKGSLGVEPVRPVREQARGLQHFLPGNNVILDEMLTTFGSDRQKAMNPYEVGKLQLGVLVGMERFLNPRTASQMDREKQRDGKAPTWEAFWNKDDNRAKHGYKVIRYPEIYR